MSIERDIEFRELKRKVDEIYNLFFPEGRKCSDISEIKLMAKQAMERSLKKRPLKVVK